MIYNKGLKDYKAPRNALTAVGYIIRQYAVMAALMVIIYLGGGLEWWIG